VPNELLLIYTGVFVIFPAVKSMDTPVNIRELIVLKYEEGHTQKRISQDLHVPTSTVYDIVKHYRMSGETGNQRYHCGSERLLSTRDDRVLRRACDGNPHATARQLQAAVGGKVSEVSISTVKRSLLLSGRPAYRPLKSPALSPSQMAVRLEWCLTHQFWTVNDWKKVIFSDESAFDVCPPRSQYVRRSPVGRISASHIAQHRPFLPRVMVWACFCYSGTGPIVPVIGTMRQGNYLTTLQDYLLPQIPQWYGAAPCVFQQDNAPCHKAHSVMNFLNEQNLTLLQWPPYSPDLSPIENLWAIVKRKVHSQSTKSKPELISRIKAIWNDDAAISDACRSLIESMPRRIQACIDARGGPTKY
jgi:transposase